MQGASLRRLNAGLCLVSIWLTGCAAFHPVEGVPARYLPTELKVGDRTGKKTIDLSLLGQTPPSAHRIDGGDVLAIYVEGFVGKSSDPPPVFFPVNNEGPASFGLPFPVREDGTISLPQVGSINLRGLTVAQAEERVKQAYLSPRELIHPENFRVQVSLQRPRQYRVLVVRQDSRNEQLSNSSVGTFNLGMVKRGTGKVVSLPAYSNDVLNALIATDGLPGLDAEAAVYIIRNRGQRQGGTLDQQWPTDLDPRQMLKSGAGEIRPVIRGQAPNEEPRYWHTNPLARAYPNQDLLHDNRPTGALHEPRRLAPADPSIKTAHYEATPNRNVDQANWTGYTIRQNDVTRAMPLPGHSLPEAGPTGIVQAGAWNESPAPNQFDPSGQFQPHAPMWAVPANGMSPAEQVRQTDPFVLQSNSLSNISSDPTAQARAYQLARNDAWSEQPQSMGPQHPMNVTPHSQAPSVYGPSPNQFVPQTQPTPFDSAGPQPPMLEHMAPGTVPFEGGYGPQGYGPQPAAPGMQPVPVGQPGMIAPQHSDPSGAAGPSFESVPSDARNLGLEGRHVIRIPIRLGPGETADIRQEDVLLQDGDIVFIESRDSEVFFTGGLLGGGQYTLPRDYDLDILQALSMATSGGQRGGARTVGGVSALNNDVTISPSTVIVLRKLPDGGEVPIKVNLYRARTDLSERIVIQPGDFILLQYTPLEAMAAFFERHLLEGALFGLATQSFTSGN